MMPATRAYIFILVLYRLFIDSPRQYFSYVLKLCVVIAFVKNNFQQYKEYNYLNNKRKSFVVI